MAKTPRLKVRNPSKHSREARRAASPPPKTIRKDADETSETQPLKQTQHYAGISKKKSKSKPLTRAQRLRREKGMERAEAVIDQLDVKRTQSTGRSKKVKERSGDWDNINVKISKAGKENVGAFAALADEDAGEAWEGEDGSEEEDHRVSADQLQEGAIQAVTKLKVSEDQDHGGAAVGEEEEEL